MGKRASRFALGMAVTSRRRLPVNQWPATPEEIRANNRAVAGLEPEQAEPVTVKAVS